MNTIIVYYRSKEERDKFINENSRNLVEFQVIYANKTDISGIEIVRLS